MLKNLLIIGGGMGPLASNVMQDIICDLQKDIITSDADYISTIHISTPAYIPERSDFLDNKIEENPGMYLADLINRTYESYKDLFQSIHVIVPCNTFHHSRITDVFLPALNPRINYINIIEVILDLLHKKTHLHKVGILSTLQTYNYGIYSDRIKGKFNLTQLTEKEALKMHHIIRKDIKMGEIKRGIKNTISFINENMSEAEAIILGCTEFGIIRIELEQAFPNKKIIDPMLESARKIVSLIL